MGISEMRRHFTAYGSGKLEEVQLRTIIRTAIARDPQLGQECMALIDAYRRANVIGPQLQSSINADILELTSPDFDATLFDGEQAANATLVDPAPPSPANPGSTGAPLSLGAVLRDRFVLSEELGRGGMGVVYKSIDRSRGEVKDCYVAIKVLSEKFKSHPLAVMSLQREARKAQRLAHPNIVAVHDFDRDGANVFMVMELLSGRSLDRVLREDGQGGIPLGPALQIIRSLAAALSYAHEHDIIHCDFKPGNAFLGRDGRIKVLDFGIARAAPAPVTDEAEPTLFDAGELGAVSPMYASCERLQRENPDVRDDVYSFACVVYEVLSGVHPFQRIDALKAFQAGLEPRPIPKLSRRQWRALKQGLAFRRADRSPTIDALAGELLAPRPLARRWLAGGAAAALAVGAAAVVWNLNRHHDNLAPANATTIAPDAAPAPAPAAAPSVVRAPTPQVVAAPPAPQATAIKIGPSSAPTPAQPRAPLDGGAHEHRHIELEALQEQFESQAIAGDIEAATKTGAALVQAAPGSDYAVTNVPRTLGQAYLVRAKAQLFAGEVNDALQTLAAGRRKYGRSVDLKDQEIKYVAAADLYDRISSAVVLNAATIRPGLDALKNLQGADFEATDQMLARTLANRIADQRAAGRATVADDLKKTGQQLFARYAQLLDQGQPGKLPASPIEVQ